MCRPPTFARAYPYLNGRLYSSSASNTPIISIQNATFYIQHPSATPSSESNPPLFPNLTFELPSTPDSAHWAIIGPSSSGKTTLLEILRGQHLSIPRTARSFPYLSSPEIEAKDHRLRFPGRAIQYVGFGGGKGGPLASGFAGAYLSARYESRREETDFSLLKYLKGETDLNPPEEREGKDTDDKLLKRVVEDLDLAKLLDMSVGNLSNGQTRRARIARALLGKPEVLLLDEPFMGLDPRTMITLSSKLERLAKSASPRMIMSLRPQDPVPEWVTHLMFLKKDCKVALQGESTNVYSSLLDILTSGKEPIHEDIRQEYELHANELAQVLTSNGIHRLKGWNGVPYRDRRVWKNAQKPHHRDLPEDEDHPEPNEAIVELKGVRVTYGSKTVLGAFSSRIPMTKEVKPGLHWTIRRGSRWGVFGPNGSGKTTLLSLLTSDHPQTYALPITHFSRPRLHTPGLPPPLSLFDLQRRIGHSSPEIHAFFPRHFSVRQTLESAFAETFRGKPVLSRSRDLEVEAFLRWFEPELNPAFDEATFDTVAYLRVFAASRDYKRLVIPPLPPIEWADSIILGSLPLSSQRVALFLRALIKRPDLLILDEAFSGMDDFVRDKCLMFLQYGEHLTIHIPPQDKRPAWERRLEKALKVTDPYRTNHESKCFRGLTDEQALVAVSHVREEVPRMVRNWICLPDADGVGLEKKDRVLRTGYLHYGLDVKPHKWDAIWGVIPPGNRQLKRTLITKADVS